MSRTLLPCTAAIAALILLSTASVASAAALETEDQKTLYAVGVALSQRLAGLGFTDAEVAAIQSGLTDGLASAEPKVDMAAYGPKIQPMLEGRAAKITEQEKTAAAGFLEEMAAAPGAVKTDSGVIYFEIEAGDGPSPSTSDTVKLHYHGTLRDGTVFDSSLEGGEPATFALDAVIPCFGDGVQKMKIGGKSKLVCPSDAAYGDRGAPPHIKPGATIIFEVELLEIVDAPSLPAATPGAGAP